MRFRTRKVTALVLRITIASFSMTFNPMALTIYHNPRCSKSREALALAQQFAEEEGISLEIIEYMKTPPTHTQLQTLQHLLGGDLRAMVRSGEDEYAALGLASADDSALLDALATHPKLLQRPVVVYRDRALIARPPELLHDFLAQASR